jgi:serine O-acetyltransferase
MTEISVVAQEIAASRQRGVLADEGKLWEKLRLDAERVAAGEEMLRGFLDLVVLHHDGFPSALGLLLARKLAEYSMRAEQLDEIARAAMAGDPGIITAAIADLVAIRTRDPAAENYLRPFLYYKGFHALQWHRISHWLWSDGRRELAHFLQSRVSQVFAVDIHPAVPIGNVEIGRDAKVGAGSIVLHDVPPRATVAGVPAQIVGWSSGSVPALEMDQSLPDYEI